MVAKIRVLGLILGLALLLYSCEDSGLIGLDVDSQNIQFKVRYEEFQLPATVTMNDSIVSQNRGRVLVGNVEDADFGKVSCLSYSQLSLGQVRPSFNESSEYDSLILILDYDYTYGENYQGNLNINVHELTEQLEDSIVYYSFSTSQFDPEPLGIANFNYVRSGEIIELDTVLKVKMSDDLGSDLFQRAFDGDSIYFTTDNFRNYFNGIALSTNDVNTSVTGFDVSNSRMEMYYHFTNSNGEVLSTSYEFTFTAAKHYNTIIGDRTGTPLAGLIEPYQEFDPGNGKVYLQSGTGITIKIDFEPFLEFSDTIPSLLINRAEFLINPADEFGFNTIPPLETVYYYTNDENRRLISDITAQSRTLQEDIPGLPQQGTAQPMIVPLDVDIDGYASTVSSYLQDLYNEEIEETQFLMYSEFSEETISINNMSIDGENIKLGVYYTNTSQPSPSN